jgi:hypothetical protein
VSISLARGDLVDAQERSYFPISPKLYAWAESDYTVRSTFMIQKKMPNMRGKQNVTPARSNTIDSQTSEEAMFVKFLLLEREQLPLVEEVPITGLQDQIIEQVAERYVNQGCFLFSSDLRSLAPL